MTYPPNPIRNLDNSLTADAGAATTVYFTPPRCETTRCTTATAATCSTARQRGGHVAARLLRDRRALVVRRTSRSSSRSRTCATSTRRSACSGMSATPFVIPGRQRRQGGPGARFRLPARRQRRHRVPLLPGLRCSITASAVRDPERRLPRGRRAPPDGKLSRSRSTATTSPSSASRRRWPRRAASTPMRALTSSSTERQGECDVVVKGVVGGLERGWSTPARLTSSATASATARSRDDRCATLAEGRGPGTHVHGRTSWRGHAHRHRP